MVFCQEVKHHLLKMSLNVKETTFEHIMHNYLLCCSRFNYPDHTYKMLCFLWGQLGPYVLTLSPVSYSLYKICKKVTCHLPCVDNIEMTKA
jgi:hypothetical protein